MDPMTDGMRAGIESGLITMAPYITVGVVAFLAIVFHDIIDSLVSALFFSVGSDMGRGKSIRWRGQDGTITKIGPIRTNIHMNDTGLIMRVPNEILRKDPYAIVPYKNDFKEMNRLSRIEADIANISKQMSELSRMVEGVRTKAEVENA